jgi:hypothetical protein
MQKPVCVPCQRYYRPKKNGFPYIEGMPRFNGATPCVADEWTPYKLWVGDKWRCPGCGNEIVIGALVPLREHYQMDFEAWVQRYAPTVTVNDC